MLDTTTLTKRRWTAEDDARLAALRALGRTDREIAAALDRTCEAVTSHRQWLRKQAAASPQPVTPEQEDMQSHRGLPWSPVDDAKLADLRRCEHSDDIIALALGRTTAAVRGRISVLKARDEGAAIPSHKRPSPITPEIAARARAMLAEGLTIHQIARRLDIYPHAISRTLKSPETTEDSPGEGVRVARTLPDIGRAMADLEQARAALTRAQSKVNEAMQPLVSVMGEAIEYAGLVTDPAVGDGDQPEDSPAWRIVDHLRRHGIELRVRP